ncbi:hypothetical protein EMCG_05618 [[Emmonsia] crescens]|uniref:Uncharacterized protein n=1 Tax=[Emmonsia] crescens TaxID=73230 RepID=A0A0G2IDM6_9EURO|nr:hypothetical protein EMCG_05618 [Emmonsia crescens UAMH 3008]
MSPEFKSLPQFLQFTGEEIEEIDKYHGLKFSRKDLPTVLFSAKTKDGTGGSDWQTFVKAKGAKDAVEREGESLEVLIHATSSMLSI